MMKHGDREPGHQQRPNTESRPFIKDGQEIVGVIKQSKTKQLEPKITLNVQSAGDNGVGWSGVGRLENGFWTKFLDFPFTPRKQ